jgi:thiol-disulfide isomerase/thioredoxin
MTTPKYIYISFFLILFNCVNHAQEINRKLIFTSHWAKGDSINLENKTIILEFWATWCRPCVASIPHFNSLAEEFSSDSVVFLSINAHDPKEKVETFLKQHTMSSNVVIDDNLKTYNKLRITSLPTTLIITPNNEIIWRGSTGQLTKENLSNYLSKGISPDVDIAKKVKNYFHFESSYASNRENSSVNVSFEENGSVTLVEFINKDLETILHQIFGLYRVSPLQYKYIGNLPIEPTINYLIKIDSASAMETKKVLSSILTNLQHVFDFDVLLTQKKKTIYMINTQNIFVVSTKEDLVLWEKEKTIYIGVEVGYIKSALQNEFDILVEMNDDSITKIDFIVYKNDFKKTLKELKKLGVKVKKKKKKIDFYSFTFN